MQSTVLELVLHSSIQFKPSISLYKKFRRTPQLIFRVFALHERTRLRHLTPTPGMATLRSPPGHGVRSRCTRLFQRVPGTMRLPGSFLWKLSGNCMLPGPTEKKHDLDHIIDSFRKHQDQKLIQDSATFGSLWLAFLSMVQTCSKWCQTGMGPKTATDPSRPNVSHGGKPTPGTLRENGSMGVVH